MKQKLFILLGDVVSSRHIADRDLFQDRLNEMCRSINEQYDNDIYAPFKIFIILLIQWLNLYILK